MEKPTVYTKSNSRHASFRAKRGASSPGLSCRPAAGFTILELIIAMTLAVIIGAVVFNFFGAAFRIFYTEENRSTLRVDTERLISQLSRELPLASEVTAAQANSVTFWIDLNGDDSQSADELFTYALSGGKVVRTNNSVSRDLLCGVTQFALSYDSAQPAGVHLVSLTLTATRGAEAITLQDKFLLRNKLE